MRQRVLGLCVMILVSSAAPALAQQNFSELRGRVVDQQGAVLPGVALVVRNQDSGQFREAVSSVDGSYLLTALVPGVYEISAELSGFKRYSRRDVRLAVGQVTTIQIQLDVGQLEETVTVTGESPLVDVTSKEIGGNLEARELIDTPTVNRNLTGYMQLLPGVVAAQLTSWGADSVSINGQPFSNTNYALDGGYNNDMWNGGAGGAQVRPPIESVQEFQVVTSQYDAEFGSASGGVLNAISKVGTNRFRGSAFGFFKDAAITKAEFFTRQFSLEKPDNKEQQYGGTLGGPVVRNKAHFFFSLERVTQDRPVTVNIPARPEFNKNVVWKDRVWNALARFDHQINANHTWALRWLQEWSPQSDQLTSAARTEATREKEGDVDKTFSGSINSVLGGTKVNTIRIHATREDVVFGNPAFFETGSQAALPPTLQMLTFLDQQSSRHSSRLDTTYGFDDTFAWFLPNKAGDHDVKFGLQYIYAPMRIGAQGNMNGTFRFNTDRRFDPTNPTTYPERLEVRVPGPLDYLMKGHFIAGFAQDKWKVNPRVTLNLGLRYDVEVVPLNERDNPRFAGQGDYPVDKNNVSPRVGVTYALDDAGRSVIRGGFGLFYQKTPFFLQGNFISSGVFADSFTVLFPAAGVDPGPSRGQFPTDPFLVNGPTVTRALLNAQFPPGTLRKNTGDVFLDSPDRKEALSRQYTIGYERQFFGDLAIRVDYIRAENRDQLVRKNLNPPTRTSTARTAPVVRPNSAFVQNVWEPVNAGAYTYDALQVMVDKRFSRGYGVRLSYTRSRARGNADAGFNSIIATQVGDDLRLDLNEGPEGDDRPHLLSMSGTAEVPHVPGLSVSPVLRYMSGTPFTLTNSQFDLNRNGRFDDEFLPPGTYSGVGRNAITVENKGGRNGARGPDFFELNLRVAYAIWLPSSHRLQLFGEFFNLTDRANFVNPGGDSRLSSSFLVVRGLRRGPTSRLGQIGIRYAF
ncbi:MAG: TonB-dependent receptor [Acidobacteria bacterium]|nr:TonB-dependent receptor [Acidobacteriota bacterium]